MTQPKVSILIATYNQQDYIKQAVSSALKQRYPNFEVIVSDDNSTDKTLDMLFDIKDSRLKVFKNEKNIGRIANHRKLLYEYATGDYVAFLDGDDFYLYDDFLKDAVDIFLKYDSVISVIGGYEDLFYNGERKSVIFSKENSIVEGQDIFFRRFKVRFAHGAWIFKRDLINKFEFFSGKVPIGDDLEGWYKSLLHGKVGILPKPVFCHRIHFDNGVVKVDADRLLEDLNLYDIIGDYGISMGFSKEVMNKWKKYNILRQSESFISWANSLYKRGIYTKDQLEKLLEEFAKNLESRYKVKLFFPKNKDIFTLQLKLLKLITNKDRDV